MPLTVYLYISVVLTFQSAEGKHHRRGQRASRGGDTLGPAGGYVGKPRAEPSGGSDSDSRPHLNVKRSLSPSPGESLQKEKKMQLGATTSTEPSPEAPAEETHAPLSSPEGREEMARHVEAATSVRQ